MSAQHYLFPQPTVNNPPPVVAFQEGTGEEPPLSSSSCARGSTAVGTTRTRSGSDVEAQNEANVNEGGKFERMCLNHV